MDTAEATYQAAVDAVGVRTCVHRDWFDEIDAEAFSVLNNLHMKHLDWIRDKNSSAKKKCYKQVWQLV